QQTLTNQIHELQQEAQQEFEELDASLYKRIEELGLPETEVEGAVKELREVLRLAQNSVARTAPTITEARAMKATIMRSRLSVPKKVQEIRVRYQPEEPAVEPEEVYMQWQNLLGQRRIGSPDDLKQVIETLQRRVYTELEQHHIVIIE